MIIYFIALYLNLSNIIIIFIIIKNMHILLSEINLKIDRQLVEQHLSIVTIIKKLLIKEFH